MATFREYRVWVQQRDSRPRIWARLRDPESVAGESLSQMVEDIRRSMRRVARIGIEVVDVTETTARPLEWVTGEQQSTAAARSADSGITGNPERRRDHGAAPCPETGRDEAQR
jgi:hypothetical protein